MELITETPSVYESLDSMSTKELLKSINTEDATIAQSVSACLPNLEKLVDVVAEKFKEGGRLFYIGAGTSGRLAVLDASEILPTYGVREKIIGLIAGGDLALRTPVENAEDEHNQAWLDLAIYAPTDQDVLVGITASGNTPYVEGGLKIAKQFGLTTGSISCNPQGTVLAYSDFPLIAVTGPEVVTGSTRMKAGTAQKMILNMLSTSLMIKIGKVKGNRMVDMQLNNAKLVKRGVQMICQETGLKEDEALQLLQEKGSVRKVIDFHFISN